MTLGTLRFEEGFYQMGNEKEDEKGNKSRNNIFTTGAGLPEMLKNMEPMFEPKMFAGKKKPKIGKYSFSEQTRLKIFDFIIKEIRKYSNCHIALCKESADVWNRLGLNPSQVQCVCQLY